MTWTEEPRGCQSMVGITEELDMTERPNTSNNYQADIPKIRGTE